MKSHSEETAADRDLAPKWTAGDSRKWIGEAALLLVTGIALYLCWLIAQPFLAAIAWALALAVAGHPMHRRLEQRLPRNLAALVSVAVIALLFLAPGFSLLREVFQEATTSLKAFAQSLSSEGIHQAAGRSLFTQKLLAWLETRFDPNQELQHAAGTLASRIPAVLKGSMQFVGQFAIMLLMLFYFFRDRRRLLQYAGYLVPLTDRETAELFRRVSHTLYATLYGNLVVKLIQGLLGGLMFWILGLPAPALFGAAMALLAMVPIVGTTLVWGPAAIFLLLHGSWVKALILVLWGSLVVGLIDNVLCPLLIAGELRLHTLGIFVAVFGGLIAFGIAGVVLGPVLLATTVALLEIWRYRTSAAPLNLAA